MGREQGSRGQVGAQPPDLSPQITREEEQERGGLDISGPETVSMSREQLTPTMRIPTPPEARQPTPSVIRVRAPSSTGARAGLGEQPTMMVNVNELAQTDVAPAQQPQGLSTPAGERTMSPLIQPPEEVMRQYTPGEQVMNRRPEARNPFMGRNLDEIVKLISMALDKAHELHYTAEAMEPMHRDFNTVRMIKDAPGLKQYNEDGLRAYFETTGIHFNDGNLMDAVVAAVASKQQAEQPKESLLQRMLKMIRSKN